MKMDPAQVRSDFDRIAKLPDDRWHVDDRFIPELIDLIPEGAGSALEVGCGSGRVTRPLAERVREVLAVDLSPGMIAIARRRVAAEHVHFLAADVRSLDLPAGSFDVVLSVATAHHLPLEWFLERCREWVRPSGIVILLDLARPEGPFRLAVECLGFVYSRALFSARNRRLWRPRRARAAWAEHAKHDSFHELGSIRLAASRILPSAEVKARFPWRYSLVWRRPAKER